ncbi:Pr6Pr family membrane protein [Sphingobium sp. AR-3-1]|uniref:Pr6Pr family membrane protein n=1 Tax=Sphingobium psychrophilum TaxID=2728834 RepID=A0A7X9WZY9_9SPHN|nr:Pr6Pr family membrane protein [Sphingobium psychrophilum]NML13032.1 Pr6Pr family membrane protein [Sphingobium psychrophilum]
MTGDRLCAAVVALVAITGLAIQFDATFAHNGSVAETLWILLRFFTVLTNMAVALTFAAIALGYRVTPRWLGGVLLAILLVGIIYGLLLRGLLSLSGGALLADTLLHKVTPLLTPLWWIMFARKGRLGWRDPWIWAIFPALYLPYALLRGMMEGKYAYPFINVATLGIGQVALNAVLIAAGFVAAGYALVWIDRRFSARL